MLQYWQEYQEFIGNLQKISLRIPKYNLSYLKKCYQLILFVNAIYNQRQVDKVFVDVQSSLEQVKIIHQKLYDSANKDNKKVSNDFSDSNVNTDINKLHAIAASIESSYQAMKKSKI